jgi:hypothetical protein
MSGPIGGVSGGGLGAGGGCGGLGVSGGGGVGVPGEGGCCIEILRSSNASVEQRVAET